MPPDPDDVLTLAEAAAYLKVHRQTLLSYAQSGRIPAARLGKQWRFRRDRILAWMDDPTASPAAAEAVAIADLLGPKTIQTRLKAAAREAAFQELAGLVDAAGFCEDGGALARKALERGVAGLANGVSLAQAGPGLVKKSVIAYGRALDAAAMFFLVCGAREEEQGQLAARLTRMCKDVDFCKELFAQNAPEGVIKAVREKEASEQGGA